MVKNTPASTGDARDVGLISGLGRSPGVGNGNPLQYSCLGNRMDVGAWWPTVHGMSKSWPRLSDETTTPTPTGCRGAVWSPPHTPHSHTLSPPGIHTGWRGDGHTSELGAAVSTLGSEIISASHLSP